MGRLLSRFSLKVQIGSLVVLAGLVLAISIAVMWVGRTDSAAANSQAASEGAIGDQAVALQIALLDGRRHEKDFLLRKDAASVAAHAEAMRQAAAALDAMTASLNAADVRRDKVAAVRQGIALYGDTFHHLVDDQTRVGLNEQLGLMGTLRGSVHEVP